MSDVRTNILETLLNITIKAKLDVNEMKLAADKVQKEARRLQSGFVVITNIRELTPASEDVRLLIQDNMKKLRDMGMAGTIRIVSPEAQITTNQFQRTSRAIDNTAYEVKSQAEAGKLLDKLS